MVKTVNLRGIVSYIPNVKILGYRKNQIVNLLATAAAAAAVKLSSEFS